MKRKQNMWYEKWKYIFNREMKKSSVNRERRKAMKRKLIKPCPIEEYNIYNINV